MVKSNIKVIEKIGKNPGKTIVIMAGVHGDEVCGVRALDKLIPEIKIDSGKVIFIYANLEAIKQNKRFIEANLNRCFLKEHPDEIKNTLEANTAREIMPYLDKADILLDLHSSNSSENLIYLICEKDCLELAIVLSPKKVIIGIDKTHKGGSDGYMFNNKEKGICIECGLHESQEAVIIAENAVINLLKKTGNIKGSADEFNEKELFNAEYIYKSKYGGFKLARKFKDFEEVYEETLIGFDKDKEVFIDKNDIVIFPNEPKDAGKECFMILRKN